MRDHDERAGERFDDSRSGRVLPDEFRAAAADLLLSGRRRAELIEDRGEAAVGEDFFRSRQFLDAEGVTHTLRIDERRRGELLAPLIVREIAGAPERDAVSPYGYPGLVSASRACRRIPAGARTTPHSAARPGVDRLLRHRPGQRLRPPHPRRPPLAGASERNVVQIADPALPPKSRMSDRQQIRKNLRNGYELRLVPGPETSAAQRAGFLAAYEQTMRRTDAAERYFFGAAYFDRILESDRTWLALAIAPDGDGRRRLDRRRAATASSTTTSAAAPTRTCATRR